MAEKEIVLEINNLHKSYGNTLILDNISLKVYKGEVFGFIGSNGIGKSTTIKCISSIIPFDGGEIKIANHDIKKEERKAKFNFGLTNDESSSYTLMSAKEYLSFIASIFKVKKGVFTERYNYYMNEFDLKKDENKLIKDYSRGMKQKVSIIAALIHEPKLWILDEPLVGLDINMADLLIKEIINFKNRGNSVFLTSHNIDVVEKICDRVVFLNNTKLSRVYDSNDFSNPSFSLIDEFRRLNNLSK